jgi:hypothetical protein
VRGDRTTYNGVGFPWPADVSLVETEVFGYSLAYYVERRNAQLGRIVKASGDWLWSTPKGDRGRCSLLSSAIGYVARAWEVKS